MCYGRDSGDRGHRIKKTTKTAVPERNTFQKANPRGREFVLQCSVFKCMTVCERERERRGQTGEKQAVTRSTTLESLFSTRPLYLMANISPGKRKHLSGQSLGNIFSLLHTIYVEASGGTQGSTGEHEAQSLVGRRRTQGG